MFSSFLRQNFHHCSPGIKEKLYQTLVRPHLDHAIAAWDPYTNKHISSIERVQRQATRFVTNTYGEDTSVTKLLNQLDWRSLKNRREAHRLTCFYKMLNGQLDIDYQNRTDADVGTPANLLFLLQIWMFMQTHSSREI